MLQELLITHHFRVWWWWAGEEEQEGNVFEHTLCIRHCVVCFFIRYLILNITKPHEVGILIANPQGESKHTQGYQLVEAKSRRRLTTSNTDKMVSPPGIRCTDTPLPLPCLWVSLEASASGKGSVGAAVWKPNHFTEVRVGGGCVTGLFT